MGMKRTTILALCLVLGACDRPDGGQADRADGAGGSVAQTDWPARIAASEPIPATLGVGRPATAAEIDALAIAIMPDGRGLPAGGASAAEGSPIYAARCAGCHGPDGEGGASDRLVGRRPEGRFDFADEVMPVSERTIGSYWPYATTLFDYIRRAMPFDAPGSLTDQEVYSLTAWLLWKNGIITEGDVVDARTLPEVVMPARDRFVRDDREQSTRVR
jgi:S-disulfanyl-L-cysteine oxidoreductase SoxD